MSPPSALPWMAELEMSRELQPSENEKYRCSRCGTFGACRCLHSNMRMAHPRNAYNVVDKHGYEMRPNNPAERIMDIRQRDDGMAAALHMHHRNGYRTTKARP